MYNNDNNNDNNGRQNHRRGLFLFFLFFFPSGILGLSKGCGLNEYRTIRRQETPSSARP